MSWNLWWRSACSASFASRKSRRGPEAIRRERAAHRGVQGSGARPAIAPRTTSSQRRGRRAPHAGTPRSSGHCGRSRGRCPRGRRRTPLANIDCRMTSPVTAVSGRRPRLRDPRSGGGGVLAEGPDRGVSSFDHDTHACWVERLRGAEPVRSSRETAFDHDVLGLRLAVAEAARSAERSLSRDHSPTVKTAQIAAPTGQMIRADPHESKEFVGKNRVKLQLVHSASCTKKTPEAGCGNHVQVNRQPAWLSGFRTVQPSRTAPGANVQPRRPAPGLYKETPFLQPETGPEAQTTCHARRRGVAPGRRFELESAARRRDARAPEGGPR